MWITCKMYLKWLKRHPRECKLRKTCRARWIEVVQSREYHPEMDI